MFHSTENACFAGDANFVLSLILSWHRRCSAVQETSCPLLLPICFSHFPFPLFPFSLIPSSCLLSFQCLSSGGGACFAGGACCVHLMSPRRCSVLEGSSCLLLFLLYLSDLPSLLSSPLVPSSPPLSFRCLSSLAVFAVIDFVVPPCSPMFSTLLSVLVVLTEKPGVYRQIIASRIWLMCLAVVPGA